MIGIQLKSVIPVLFSFLFYTSHGYIQGGTFSNRKLFEADILLSMDNCGPIMCVGYCFIYSGCVAIHYNAKHLLCHLLTKAVICKDKKERRRKRFMFTDIKDWTMVGQSFFLTNFFRGN